MYLLRRREHVGNLTVISFIAALTSTAASGYNAFFGHSWKTMSTCLHASSKHYQPPAVLSLLALHVYEEYAIRHLKPIQAAVAVYGNATLAFLFLAAVAITGDIFAIPPAIAFAVAISVIA